MFILTCVKPPMGPTFKTVSGNRKLGLHHYVLQMSCTQLIFAEINHSVFRVMSSVRYVRSNVATNSCMFCFKFTAYAGKDET